MRERRQKKKYDLDKTGSKKNMLRKLKSEKGNRKRKKRAWRHWDKDQGEGKVR